MIYLKDKRGLKIIVELDNTRLDNDLVKRGREIIKGKIKDYGNEII